MAWRQSLSFLRLYCQAGAAGAVGTPEMVLITPCLFFLSLILAGSRQNRCDISKPVFLAWDLLVFLILSCIPENQLGVQSSFVGREREVKETKAEPAKTHK